MARKVIHPLGPCAGCEVDLVDSLLELGIQMQADAANGHEREMELYSVALSTLALQLRPEKYSPAVYGRLVGLARRYDIVLPDWMAE